MSHPSIPSGGTPQQNVIVERSYSASVEDLWALWTTKDGFESWWGPEGFRVDVHALDPRAGGALEYDMIADARTPSPQWSAWDSPPLTIPGGVSPSSSRGGG